MRNKKMQRILEGFKIISPNEYYQHIAKLLSDSEKRFVITANPEIVMMIYRDEIMKGVCDREDTDLIPDGIGVVSVLKRLLKIKNIQRNTGIDLVSFLLTYANENSNKVFIYGAKQEVLEDFLNICKINYPNIIFTNAINGYVCNQDEVKQAAIESDADIYFVALGAPRQELFIESIYGDIQHGICIGIGGSIDVLSGHTKRAPEFLLKNNLEWLYRILSEPKRIRRFIFSNCVFWLNTVI